MHCHRSPKRGAARQPFRLSAISPCPAWASIIPSTRVNAASVSRRRHSPRLSRPVAQSSDRSAALNPHRVHLKDTHPVSLVRSPRSSRQFNRPVRERTRFRAYAIQGSRAHGGCRSMRKARRSMCVVRMAASTDSLKAGTADIRPMRVARSISIFPTTMQAAGRWGSGSRMVAAAAIRGAIPTPACDRRNAMPSGNRGFPGGTIAIVNPSLTMLRRPLLIGGGRTCSGFG